MKSTALKRLSSAALVSALLLSAPALVACGSSEDPNLAKYSVQIEVSCNMNTALSRYDMNIYVDEKKIANLDHGAAETYTLTLTEGDHRIRIANEDDDHVDGSAPFTVDGEETFEFTVTCKRDQVEVVTGDVVQDDSADAEVEAEAGDAAEDVAEDTSEDTAATVEAEEPGVWDTLVGEAQKLVAAVDNEVAKGAKEAEEAEEAEKAAEAEKAEAKKAAKAEKAEAKKAKEAEKAAAEAEKAEAEAAEEAEKAASEEGAAASEADADQQEYFVKVKLSCEKNKVFSKYDLVVYVDDEQVGTLEHGDSDTYKLTLTGGEHTLKLVDAEDDALEGTAEFTVDSDETFEFEASCKKDGVEVEAA